MLPILGLCYGLDCHKEDTGACRAGNYGRINMTKDIAKGAEPGERRKGDEYDEEESPASLLRIGPA